MRLQKNYVLLLLVLGVMITGLIPKAFSASLNIVVLTSTQNEQKNVGKSFAGITTKPVRNIERASKLALIESSDIFKLFGIDATLNRIDIADSSDAGVKLANLPKSSLILLDIPKSLFLSVARKAIELELVTVNVRHPDQEFRHKICSTYLFHTIPSHQMYFDALAQFLIHKGWRKVLVIRGPSEDDELRSKSLVKSLKKFGTSVQEERVYSLSHHPDDRDKNRPDFLTGGVSYDVVAIIDSASDYGRYFQYNSRRPRPIVGDVGLIPRGWHYALERYGAPQLNGRYRDFLPGQLSELDGMTDTEFAAWTAIKYITNSLHLIPEASDSIDVKEIYSLPDGAVDLYKGTRGSFRAWNHQLRQPMLLTTTSAVIAVAPMPKFLHPAHYADTLGIDAPESKCRLDQ